VWPLDARGFSVDPNEATAVETVDFLVDFERAEVITPMIHPPRPRLVVSGVTAFPVQVTLVPLVYVSRPPYWGIQVVGSNPATPQATPAITNVPYDVELDLEGLIGSEGVEVIGATRTERIAVTTS
jgi:hypothetical protein